MGQIQSALVDHKRVILSRSDFIPRRNLHSLIFLFTVLVTTKLTRVCINPIREISLLLRSSVSSG